MIPCMDRVPAIMTGTMMAIPAGISYETTWAAPRTAPKSDHLELEVQPDTKMPTTIKALVADR